MADDATSSSGASSPHSTPARALQESLIAEAKTEALRVQSELDKTDWGAIATSVRAHMKSGRINVAAQAFAYRWFLSIFPTIIALLGVATLVTLPQS
ncbi:MAG TPA: hypothetical protein VMF33_05120, partial [Acidimicrobiales bacterium]|nr:hypothetical protein [Acidimicrobiales bacterium]